MFLAREIPPDRTVFGDAQRLALDDADARDDVSNEAARTTLRIPARVVDLLERVACHRDATAPGLMYRLLWRVVHDDRRLLDDAADPDVIALTRFAREVDRAAHKMTAFVRFREVATEAGAHYFAWFEPEHDVLARTAPFFARRFGTLVWTIATPDGTAHWDRHQLHFFDFDPSAPRPDADATEALWLAYYGAIFNPARLNVALMCREMPSDYWKNLPETRRIPALVAEASERAGRMLETTGADPARAAASRDKPPRQTAPSNADVEGIDKGRTPPPDKPHLDACRRCPLGAKATQGVPGEGPPRAPIMLVGEQPGDEEDLAGRPFVGPAGRLLRRAIAEAGLEARDVYITNAVKHFSFEPRGKRRIHKTPAQREIEACRSWLEAEIAAVAPRVIVALGATALSALMQQRMKVGEARERELHHPSGARIMASYHPSAALRAPDEDAKAAIYRAIVADLGTAARFAGR